MQVQDLVDLDIFCTDEVPCSNLSVCLACFLRLGMVFRGRGVCVCSRCSFKNRREQNCSLRKCRLFTSCLRGWFQRSCLNPEASALLFSVFFTFQLNSNTATTVFCLSLSLCLCLSVSLSAYLSLPSPPFFFNHNLVCRILTAVDEISKSFFW